MIIGYGHVPAAADLATVARLRQDLTEAGADAVFVETGSPATAGAPLRPALDCALATAGQGDVLLSLVPGHLARSVAELLSITNRLSAQGASLRIPQVTGQQELDTATPTGATMLAALGLLAAFDRPGAPSLFQVGMYQPGDSRPSLDITANSFVPRRPRGRPPTASNQASEIARLRAAGMRATDIADRLRICRASVYRVINMTTTSPTGVGLGASEEQRRPLPATVRTDFLSAFRITRP